MNLRELLDELRNNILRDTSYTVDQRGDENLWSDETLVRYINDAQSQFAARTLCLRDETTPAITQVALVAGQDTYTLDDRVVAVLGARIGNRHLARTTYGGLMKAGAGSLTLASPVNEYHHSSQAYRFYTDRESGKVGVWPAPDLNHLGTLVLRVARKPLTPLVVTNLKAEPEVKEEFHLDLLEWAAWRALRNHDRDAENVIKANSHRARFNDAVTNLAEESKRLLASDIQFDIRTNWSNWS